jgi:outer membrane protein assembly factor BamB
VRRFTALYTFVLLGIAYGQRGAGDWMTSGGDAQRSSWIRTDVKISPKNMVKPGLSLVWKLKLADGARELTGLTPPVLVDFYIGYRGFRTLSFFGANSNKVVAVDSDLSRVEWEDKYSPPSKQSTPGCPGGMTSAVTRPTNAAYPPIAAGALGRGTPAKSGVGDPHEGSVVLAAIAARKLAMPAPAPAAKKKIEPNPFAPHIQYVLALSADGKLHSIWVSNGNETSPGIDFVPANAHAFGLVSYDDTAYVATDGDCGKAGNGIWSLDLNSKKVNHWSTAKPIAGSEGPAAGPDGKLYVGAGDELVALSPGQLEVLAIHKLSGSEFSSSPVVFDFHGKNLLAIASRDGRLNLLDTAALNNPHELDRTDPFTEKDSPTGALASWQDFAGTRWVLAPGRNAVVAWKVVDRNGAPGFERGWTSRDLLAPLPPLIVNGVVFALSSGEFAPGNRRTSAADRIQKSKPAVLYALDGRSGQELWNSGSTIDSFVNNGGLSAGGTRVYVATHDGTQYAFGFPIEH